MRKPEPDQLPMPHDKRMFSLYRPPREEFPDSAAVQRTTGRTISPRNDMFLRWCRRREARITDDRVPAQGVAGRHWIAPPLLLSGHNARPVCPVPVLHLGRNSVICGIAVD